MVTLHHALTRRSDSAHGLPIVETNIQPSSGKLTEIFNISNPMWGLDGLGEITETGETLDDVVARLNTMHNAVVAAGIQTTEVVEDGDWEGEENDVWVAKNYIRGTRITRPGDEHYPDSFTPILDEHYTAHEWTPVITIDDLKKPSRRKLVVIDDFLLRLSTELQLDYLLRGSNKNELARLLPDVFRRVVDPEREPWFAANDWEPLSFHLGEGEKTVLARVRHLTNNTIGLVSTPAPKPDTGSRDRELFGAALSAMGVKFFN